MADFAAGIKYLSEHGLNMVSVLNCIDLPEKTATNMSSSGIPLVDYRRLMLIGHGGRLMWEKLQSTALESKDPVDQFATSITRSFIHDYLDNSEFFWLFPEPDYSVPLQQLGEAAGWCSPSPLGLGISAEFGLWFAYRAAFLIDSDLPLTSVQPHLSPCSTTALHHCLSTRSGAERGIGYRALRAPPVGDPLILCRPLSCQAGVPGTSRAPISAGTVAIPLSHLPSHTATLVLCRSGSENRLRIDHH